MMRKRRNAISSNGNAEGGDPNFMTSLARGLAVVCAFSDHRRSLTIPEISELTGFSRAAVRRCLYTLAKLGYVSPGPRTFDLEPKVLELGHAYLSSTPLVPAAQPILDRLCERFASRVLCRYLMVPTSCTWRDLQLPCVFCRLISA